MADDLGYKDLGFTGGDFFHTPFIDRLSTESMIFTQSYSSASNCAPSRASLMTGMYTPRHKVFTVSPSARGNTSHRKIIPTRNTDSLAHNAFTLGELFRSAGYRTGVFGKWHLGFNPQNQGFDVNVAGSTNGSPGKHGHFSPYNLRFISDGPDGEYLSDRITDEAISFIKSSTSEPFFLYLPYYAVHTPLLAPDSLVEKYRLKENPTQIHPTYAAMVERLDWNVGRLLKELDNLGLTRNTMIIFTSDNGGIRALSDQAPLRAGKGSYYEGGVRVPTLIKWENKIEKGSVYRDPIINLDFFPTFVDLLGIDYSVQNLDGVSLIPVFQGQSIPKRPLYWHFPIYLQAYHQDKDDGRDPLFRTRPGSTVLYGNWKLHHYFEDDDYELFNLSVDLGERNNLIEKQTEQFMQLKEMLEAWRSKVDAPIPSEPNPHYQNQPVNR